jgi:hypothetical protein
MLLLSAVFDLAVEKLELPIPMYVVTTVSCMDGQWDRGVLATLQISMSSLFEAHDVFNEAISG